jgi:cellulose synthase/poly-beta-1,6-N-acetylglucosamine synthase-like glycosyltransferase
LFDMMNPGLAALDLPIALGGSSNHFRTQTLRRVCGRDAWNVTEDADLGVRLARFGAGVGVLASDTREEAPNEYGNWFRQRMRWQKGWMQTLIVHSRQPIRLYRELGAARTCGVALLIAGALLGGLFGPMLLLETLAHGFREAAGAREPLSSGGDVITYILAFWGFQTLAVPAVVAVRRRRLAGVLRALVTMPAYYALISLATWAALFELIVRPFYWSKTEHGRTRSASATTRLAKARANAAGT